MKVSQLLYVMEKGDMIVIDDYNAPIDNMTIYEGTVRGITRDNPINQMHVSSICAQDDTILVLVEKSKKKDSKTMSNEKKQIEEMAKYCPCYFGEKCCIDGELPEKCDMLCQFGTYAEILYNAGYRKQSENTVELPCKVGDKVWCISNYTKPKEFQITILTMSENHYSFVIEADKGVYKHYCDKDSVGKYVFFTKEEAEKALAKMKGGAE